MMRYLMIYEERKLIGDYDKENADENMRRNYYKQILLNLYNLLGKNSVCCFCLPNFFLFMIMNFVILNHYLGLESLLKF